MTKRYTLTVATMFLILSFFGGIRASAETLSYFRRDRGLAADDARLPDKFDSSEQVWMTELPPGISTPCVFGDKIFVTIFRKNENELAIYEIN